MEIQVRFEGTVPLCALKGRLDAQGAAELDRTARSLEGQGSLEGHGNAWILELSSVDYMSSMGLRSLLAVERSLRARRGGLVLLGAKPFVEQVLQLSGVLSMLRRAGTLAEAVAEARSLSGERHQGVVELPGRRYAHRRVGAEPPVLDVWGTAANGPLAAKDLTTVSLEDLGIALGIGGFGLGPEQAAENLGGLLTIGRLAALLPPGDGALADFLMGDDPESTLVHIGYGAGFTGAPSFVVEVEADAPLPLATLLEDLRGLLQEADGAELPLLGMAAFVEDAMLAAPLAVTLEELAAGGGPRDTTPVPAARALLVGLAAGPRGAETLRAASRLLPGPSSMRLQAVVLGPGSSLEALADPYEAVRGLSAADLPLGSCLPSPESTIVRGTVWIWAFGRVRAGAEKLVAVECDEEGTELREEWRAILRRLFHDCGRVVLTPLHGGFMSKTFRVVGYDRDGRRQIPTVVKLGPIALTRREEEAHKRYVEKFILNNSTTILGTATAGEWAGLRYNFLGIGGPESKLTWLKDHYLKRPVPEVLELLTGLYTRVLKPWYGQPRWEPLPLFSGHDPGGLFPDAWRDGERLLGISADDLELECPELGLTLPNPLRFLKHEYPRRARETRLWYSSICHGDLNLQNVLVDERDNLYVIDFSETRPRNAVSDFARLEPIVKLELPRLETAGELEELLQMEVGLTSVRSLGEVPPFTYRGSDPQATKAYETIRLLRRLADIGTLFETDIVPYWLAVLEWTYSVLSYWSVSPLRKRHAAMSAALIVRSIQELETAR